MEDKVKAEVLGGDETIRQQQYVEVKIAGKLPKLTKNMP